LTGKKQEKHEYLNWEIQLSGWFQTLPNGGFRQSVRIGNWKGVRYGIDSAIELYNLSEDEEESLDISNNYPDIIEKINKIFKNKRDDTPAFPYGGVKQDYKSQDKYTFKNEK